MNAEEEEETDKIKLKTLSQDFGFTIAQMFGSLILQFCFDCHHVI